MKQRILYEAYCGGEPYIFLRFDQSDNADASKILSNLMERQFRVFYNEHDQKTIPGYEELASRILACELAVFLISKKALASLAFRSSINYALSKKKKIFCVYLDDEKMDFGFDIQLANVPGAHLSAYKDADELCGDMVKTGLFLQTMRGEGSKVPVSQTRRKRAAVIAIAAVVAVFVVSASLIGAYRINYENSKAGQLEKITQTDYFDISEEDASLIGLLEGKTIGTLVARDMDLVDIGPLGSINCEVLDISQNPSVNTLEPLLENRHLKTVKVTQDMYPAIVRIAGRHPFQIVVTG